MANNYYNNTTNLIVDGTSADASDVENKCDDIAAGFDTLQVDMGKTLNLTMTDITSRDFNITKALRAGKAIGFHSTTGELKAISVASQDVIDKAEAARDAAWAWSSEDEDTSVSDGINPDGFSSYHWSVKAHDEFVLAASEASDAASDAAAAANSANNALISANNASSSEAAASSSASLAEDWATELEDVEVTTGKYSAYHWAQKAEDWGTVIDDTTASSTTTYSSTKQEAEFVDVAGDEMTGPLLVSNHNTYSAASVTPDLDTYSTFEITGSVAVTINNPTITSAGAWNQVRSGYFIVRGTIPSVTWGSNWKFRPGEAPSGGSQVFIFFTVHSPTNITCEVWST